MLNIDGAPCAFRYDVVLLDDKLLRFVLEVAGTLRSVEIAKNKKHGLSRSPKQYCTVACTAVAISKRAVR